MLPDRMKSLATMSVLALLTVMAFPKAIIKSPSPSPSLSAYRLVAPSLSRLSLITKSPTDDKSSVPVAASIPPVLASSCRLPSLPVVLKVKLPAIVSLSEVSAALSLSASKIKSPVSAVTLTATLMPSSALAVSALKVESAVSKLMLALSLVASKITVPVKASLSEADILLTVIEPEVASPI